MINKKIEEKTTEVERNKDLMSTEIRAKVDALIAEIKGIPEDPETLKAGEKLHRELSFLSPEDLLKPFTI